MVKMNAVFSFAPLFLIASARGFSTVGRPGFVVKGYQAVSSRYCTAGDGTPIVAAAAPVLEELTELSRLEIRVGKIVEIAKHPEADSLYVEKVDCGEADGPRTIVSGLVEFCTIEQLLNRNVIVLCNLKPRPLKGILSAGMLLCASSVDKTQVEPLSPPEGCPPGQLITFKGHKSDPAEAGNRASKAYGKVADEFFVNDDGVATFQGIPFMTPLGAVKSNLKGKIS